jgi:hypothetical protein
MTLQASVSVGRPAALAAILIPVFRLYKLKGALRP